MATVTPNYSWPVPQSSDYVKDGADAIKDLGDAIDATVFGLGTAGLTLINSTPFSAVSSISLPTDTFTSTYKYYRIIWNPSAFSGSLATSVRFRTSGTDNSTSNYSFTSQRYNIAINTITDTSTIGATSGTLNTAGGAPVSFVMDVISPQVAEKTMLINRGVGDTGDNWTNTIVFTGTTVFDSMSFIASANNFTGTVKVYGYAN